MVTGGTIDLSSNINKLGRHTVCPNEVVIYECSSYSNTLIWRVNSPSISPVIYHANDNIITPKSQRIEYATVTILESTMMHMKAQLTLPFTPKWNGNMIQCSNENHTSQLKYTTAGNTYRSTLICIQRLVY